MQTGATTSPTIGTSVAVQSQYSRQTTLGLRGVDPSLQNLFRLHKTSRDLRELDPRPRPVFLGCTAADRP